MPTPSPKGFPRRTEARLVRLTPAEPVAWKAAAAASIQGLSEFARQAIEAELRRREGAGVQDPFGFGELLERARGAVD